MSKRLIASTIIPADLYVEREADRQLTSVIEHMGRPAYILVARQMGKTNLLLNTRRRMESADLKFIYMDLSSNIRSLSEHYATICETFLDLHGSAIGLADGRNSVEILEALRNEVNNPHRVFEGYLRNILSKYAGRLVFILDEVDSLIGSGFSDSVFSQIRSLYFARTNYPELNRVTYVLSGVAEPGDLIKDRNVSPFNIGEKIYLQDFTRNQYEEFVERADIRADEQVIARVFHWARGNPRMTWDILSEIEDLSARASAIPSVDDVDRVVHRLYFEQADRPPVDHIRMMVTNDRTLRRALSNLRANEPTAILPEERTRLYLAGIVESPVSEGALNIKNPIIDYILSPDWLASIARREKDAIFLARELFRDNRFADAIELYEQALDPMDLATQYSDALELGVSYNNTRNYAAAAEWFRRTLEANPPAELREVLWYNLGVSQVALREYSNAISSFRENLKGQRGTYRHESSVNLAAALIAVDPVSHQEEIIRLNQTVKQESSPDVHGKDPIVRSLAFANLAKLYLAIASPEIARAELNEALRSCSREIMPALGALFLQTRPLANEAHSVANQMALEILEGLLAPAEAGPDSTGLLFSETTLFRALAGTLLFGDEEIFQRLLSYVETEIFKKTRRTYALFEEMLSASIGWVEDLTGLFGEIVSRCADEPDATALVWRAAQALAAGGSSNRKIVELYLRRFDDVIQPEISAADYYAVFHLLGEKAVLDDIDLLDQTVMLAYRLREVANPRRKGELVLVLFRLMSLAAERGRVEESKEIAQELLRHLGEVGVDPKIGFTTEVVQMLRNTADRTINDYSRRELQSRIPKGIGRNYMVKVRYDDGLVVTRKYKLLQRDIVVGRCEIIDVLGPPSKR